MIIIRKPNPITAKYPIALDAKPVQTLLLRFPSFFDFPSSQRTSICFFLNAISPFPFPKNSNRT